MKKRAFLGGLLLAASTVAVVTPVRPVVVTGPSMSPTYRDGEVLASTIPGAVRPGDVVVLRQGKEMYVKRVALVGGERYRKLAGPSGPIDLVEIDPTMIGPRHAVVDAIVPPGHVYVLGDRLAHSTDSRDFGPIPLARVERTIVDRREPSEELRRPFATLRRYADPSTPIPYAFDTGRTPGAQGKNPGITRFSAQ